MFDDVAFPIIRQKLIDVLGFKEHEIIAHTDERVHAKHGQKKQINIYPSLMTPTNSGDQHVGQEYISGFNVGITLRVPTIASDKLWKDGYTKDILGILRGIVWTLRAQRLEIQSEINTTLSAQPTPDDPPPFYPWKLVEPYRFAGDTASVREVGPEHFHADAKITDVRADYGLHVIVRYDSGRYMAFSHPTQVPGIEVTSSSTVVVTELSAAFTNTSVGVAPLTYQWDFGDGNTSTDESPTHVYAPLGSSQSYTVTLITTSDDGQDALSTQTVVITPTLPDLESLTIPELEAQTIWELENQPIT